MTNDPAFSFNLGFYTISLEALHGSKVIHIYVQHRFNKSSDLVLVGDYKMAEITRILKKILNFLHQIEEEI